jgi:hypothetical protein
MLAQVHSYLRKDRLVGPHIDGFRKPAAQFGLGTLLSDERYSDFRGAPIVRTVEGNRADGIAMHALLGFFPEPFFRPMPNLHRRCPLLFSAKIHFFFRMKLS